MSIPRWGWMGLFCFSLLSGLAQRNGPAAQSEPHASVPPANRSIVLDVVVTNKSGKPVPGLQQGDFTLLDNKLARKIASFHAVEGGAATADPPVEVIFLVDGINASYSNVVIESNEIGTFLKQNGGQLSGPASIVLFSYSGTTMGSTSARDGNALIAALGQERTVQRTMGDSLQFYGEDERQQFSLHTLEHLADYEAAKPGRKLVIWISPGWPLLYDPEVGLTAKEQLGLFNSIVAFSEKLRRARITLYDVDPSGLADANELGTADYGQFVKGVKTAKQAQIGNLGLQALASQSGGRVLNSSNDIAGEIATCLTDANGYYVLSFDGPAGDGPNEYHSLEIKIDKPGATARTRSGYYAQPERAPAR
ncbi:MAG: VWA domain-containing protein [Bryobacteraceae bacterium]